MNINTLYDATTTLRHGGTLLYPTDTIWGIGCDATNTEAVEKIYRLKQRDHAKSMLVLALPEWTACDNSLAERYLADPRPTTVILPARELYAMPPVAQNLLAADGTIGVRIPQGSQLCLQLLQELGSPIVSTSANLAGRSSPTSFAEIDPDVIARVDYTIDPALATDNRCTQSSRIVKIVDGQVEIIRE